MPDLRLYRISLIPAAVAAIVLAFSLAPVPTPLPVEPATTLFDQGAAVRATKRIAAAADRGADDAGGDPVARLVAESFTQVRAGTVARQSFLSGEGAALTNVLLTLPGDSRRTILILAARGAAQPPAVVSSAAATGLLTELAAGLGGSDHRKTLVLASVDGVDGGAVGTGELLDALPQRGELDAAVVLSQPGLRERRQPLVVASSSDSSSTSAQLLKTAQASVSESAGEASQQPGWPLSLARLAFPSGLGEQAAMIAAGIDAVTLTSAGEAPLPASEDVSDRFGGASVAAIGRATVSLVAALDQAPAATVHGPGSYVEFAGNLVPGWGLALLALALLVAPLPCAISELARAGRRRGHPRRALDHALRWALPALAALLGLYLLGLAGLVPQPRFPFDPNRFGIGARALLVFTLLAAVVVLVARAQRIWRPPAGCARETLAAAAGLLAVVGGLIAWASNPFLGLLAAPLAHVWLPLAHGRGRWVVVAAVVAAAAPILLALALVTSTLGWGISAPWQLTLLIADGQLGPLGASALALLAGATGANLAVAALPSDLKPPTDREGVGGRLSGVKPGMAPSAPG